jgi:outer membrane protein assembly factor BamB
MGTSLNGSAAKRGNGLGASGALLLCALALTGCADAFVDMSMPSMPKLDDINPWAEKPVPLPGKRVAVIQQENVSTNLAGAEKPITLPLPQQNESWTQPGGVASNAPGHLAFGGAVKSAWTADIGTGSSFYGKLTASPIVYDGKVYALDAAGKVSAFNMAGESVWRVSVTPPGEKDREGFGGGLATDGGRIYVGTGYGYVVALDARTGQKLWEKYVESPVRSSPTAAVERVFVLTKEGQVFCLSGSDGAELWKFRGLGEKASLLTNASPAIEGDVVVVPYPTGDLMALRVSDGQAVWSESLARTRTASSTAAA